MKEGIVKMKYQDELIRIYDEVMEEILEGDTLDEDDKLDFELLRETMIAEITKEMTSKEDDDFLLNNLYLHKRLIKAVVTNDERETKRVLVEMLQLKRQ